MLRARLLGAATATAITATTAQSFFGGDPAPPPHAGPVTAESVLISARAIAAVAKIGFVCTADPGGGAPHCRVMDLRGPTDDSLAITLVTRATTRKAGELARDARCTVAFHGGSARAGGENGYLSLGGSVTALADPAARRAAWKESWTLFHTAPEVPDSGVVVYEFAPDVVELVDNDRWLRGDWRPVTLRRRDGAWVVDGGS